MRHDGWWVNSHHSGCLHYRIGTEANFARMWRIAHAFCVECDKRGFAVSTAASGHGRCRGGVTIRRGDFADEVTFHETGRRGPRKPSWGGTIGTIEPTGLLKLMLGHGATSGQVLAGDGTKRWRLEDRLGKALERLETIAQEQERRAAQWAERDRLAADANAQEQAQQEAVALAASRRQNLLDTVTNFASARAIREFVAEARRSRDLSLVQVEYLRWALAEADSLDPLRSQFDALGVDSDESATH